MHGEAWECEKPCISMHTFQVVGIAELNDYPAAQAHDYPAAQAQAMFPSLVASTASVDWLAIRNATLATVWDGALPTKDKPDAIKPTTTPGITELTWTMKDPNFYLNSTVYHAVRHPNLQDIGTVVIMHHGHAKACDVTLPENTCKDPTRSWYDYYNLTDYLHQDLNVDFYTVYMPLYGPNAQPGLPSDHSWFERWEAKGVKTMRFFLEPVILTINLALRSGYTNVVMMGKSGGGWTTTVAAALDPRISFSAPIAGSIPLTFPHKSWDFEQQPRPSEGAGWYLGDCNYTCLYTLAALEPRRNSLQMLHENDPCCYYGKGRHAGIMEYDANVSAALVATGAAHGGFSTVVSNWNVHAVCQMDRLLLKTALGRVDADPSNVSFGAMACDMLRGENLTCPIPAAKRGASAPSRRRGIRIITK